MNKQLLRFVRLTAIAMALSLVSLSVQADELIFLENNFDTSTDQAELIPLDQKGSVSWDAATKTLTLRSVRISSPAPALTGWMPEEITIRVEGSNSIECTSLSKAIEMRSAIRLTGSGTLSIKTQGNAAITCTNGGITIADKVALIVSGASYGIDGAFRTSLTVDNAFLYAYINPNSQIPNASIGYFTEINLKNCQIVSPEGAKLGSIYGATSVTVDGEHATTEPVIIAPQKGYAKVTIADHAHGKVSAPQDVDLTNVLIGTSITFTAEPKEGYALTKLMAGTEDITNTLTLLVKEDVTVIPTFTADKAHKVTLVKPEHGTLTVRETEYNLDQVPEGSILHFVCTPDEGYELESLKAGDNDITADMYITVTADIEIRATYKLIPVPKYKVHIVVLGYGNVKADYPDLDAVPDGTTIHLTCTPKTANDKLISLTVNDEDIMETKSFVILGGDARVNAVFKRDRHPAVEAPTDETHYSIKVSDETLTIADTTDGMPILLCTALGETLVQMIATGCDHINLSDIPAGVYILSVGGTSYKLYL